MNKKLIKFAKKIVPMVWNYKEDVTLEISTSTWKK
jgi:hypothetical protein